MRVKNKTNYMEDIHSPKSAGQRVSDVVAATVGSWKFILTQSGIIVFWIFANTIGLPGLPRWDPFPFIFLNLTLSFQAAYTAPIIMMSENRQNQIDRSRSETDLAINQMAEKEIELIQVQLETIRAEGDESKALLKSIHNQITELKKNHNQD